MASEGATTSHLQSREVRTISVMVNRDTNQEEQAMLVELWMHQ